MLAGNHAGNWSVLYEHGCSMKSEAFRKLELAIKHPDTLVCWRPFEYVTDNQSSFRPHDAYYRMPTEAARKIIFNMMGKPAL